MYRKPFVYFGVSLDLRDNQNYEQYFTANKKTFVEKRLNKILNKIFLAF